MKVLLLEYSTTVATTKAIKIGAPLYLLNYTVSLSHIKRFQ